MAERALGHVLAPGELWTSEKASEETCVQRVENFFEMVEAAFRAGETLVATRAPNEFGLRVTAAEEAKRL